MEIFGFTLVRRKKLRYYKDMATIAERLIRTARKLGPYYGADKKFLRLDPLFNHVVMGEGALGDIEKILVKTVWPEEAPRA